jgi:hypothetical protein
MPFSKHSWLLFVGFVKHDWQLKQDEVILNKNFLKLGKILIKITSAYFSCQSLLTKPTNKSQGCFENGTNSSCSWYNSFFLKTLLSCQKQGPKWAYFDLFLGHPMFVLLGWVYF